MTNYILESDYSSGFIEFLQAQAFGRNFITLAVLW